MHEKVELISKHSSSQASSSSSPFLFIFHVRWWNSCLHASWSLDIEWNDLSVDSEVLPTDDMTDDTELLLPAISHPTPCASDTSTMHWFKCISICQCISGAKFMVEKCEKKCRKWILFLWSECRIRMGDVVWVIRCTSGSKPFAACVRQCKGVPVQCTWCSEYWILNRIVV